jgi:hypothetical protein
MRRTGCYIMGSVMFVGAVVMVICAFAGTAGSFAVEGSLPIVNMILAVGFLVTGGLFHVAGAILDAAEQVADGKSRIPESRAEPDASADRPRDIGSGTS